MDERIPYLLVGCAALVLSALGVVLAKKPVHSAVALLVNSLSIATLYLLLSAEFAAVGQIILYSGAIVVLFLFVVLLLPHGGVEARSNRARAVGAVVGAGALFAALAHTLLTTPPAPAAAEVAGGASDVGRSLFGALLVPFELTTLPMLLAIIAGVTLWRRQEKELR